jgi:hypothetical protein
MLKHLLICFIFLITILSVNSCDQFNHIEGLVIDEKTNKPIDSVHVYININGQILDSFSSVEDRKTKRDRLDYISKYGNDEKWIDTTRNYMIRYIPTITEGGGRFEIVFPVGFSHYKLYLEKSGYELFEIRNKQINWSKRPIIFKMKKKSGA